MLIAGDTQKQISGPCKQLSEAGELYYHHLKINAEACVLEISELGSSKIESTLYFEVQDVDNDNTYTLDLMYHHRLFTREKDDHNPVFEYDAMKIKLLEMGAKLNCKFVINN